MAEPKLFSTDNTLKVQKGQNVEEGTKEKHVGDKYSCVNHPETDMDCLQGFHYNHRFYINSSSFEGLDPHEQLRRGHRGFVGYHLTQPPPYIYLKLLLKKAKKIQATSAKQLKESSNLKRL